MENWIFALKTIDWEEGSLLTKIYQSNKKKVCSKFKIKTLKKVYQSLLNVLRFLKVLKGNLLVNTMLKK